MLVGNGDGCDGVSRRGAVEVHKQIGLQQNYS